MNKRKIDIIINKPLSDEKDDVLKDYYNGWRKFNKSTNASFAAIYSTFRDKHLADLEAGPLRLYLYFSFYANNETGHSWHSIQTIAKFFNAQTRTIDNWIHTLVEKGLIYREKTDKVSNTTFLIPYSDTVLYTKLPKKYEGVDQGMVDDMASTLMKREKIYGEIVAIYHLFQWRTVKGVKVLSEPHNALLIITKRENDIVIGHVYRTKSLKDYGVDEEDVDTIATFDSPLKYNGQPIKGIFIKNEFQIFLPKNATVLNDLVQQLAITDEENLDLHPIVNYGLISELNTRGE